MADILVDKCEWCGRELRTVKEAHAVQGALYCSEECALNDIKTDLIRDLDNSAQEIYNNTAEVIATEDIL